MKTDWISKLMHIMTAFVLMLPIAVNAGIIGNRNSRVYYMPWCTGYTAIAEEDRVYFDTTTEAKAAGYRLAKNCSPTGCGKSR